MFLSITSSHSKPAVIKVFKRSRPCPALDSLQRPRRSIPPSPRKSCPMTLFVRTRLPLPDVHPRLRPVPCQLPARTLLPSRQFALVRSRRTVEQHRESVSKLPADPPPDIRASSSDL